MARRSYLYSLWFYTIYTHVTGSCKALTPSILGHVFTMIFEHDLTILLPLGRVYRGQEINGHSLYYFDPSHEVLSLYKIEKTISSRTNAKIRASTEGIKCLTVPVFTIDL